MIRTNGDIITEFLVRNNYTTTDGFISDSNIRGWLSDAHTWAASQKKWPMTEGRYSTTSASATPSEDGWTRISYPEGLKADSIRRLSVGGFRYQKKNFYKFAEFLEDNSDDTSKIYSDYGRQLYINPNASDFSGTVTMWFQYQPILDVTDYTATTIFSDFDEEANEAIILKMSSYLHLREQEKVASQIADQAASEKLNEVWNRIQDEQFAYQDTNNEGWMKRFDVLHGGFNTDLFKRDQF
jgi:hypothetical protein